MIIKTTKKKKISSKKEQKVKGHSERAKGQVYLKH